MASVGFALNQGPREEGCGVRGARTPTAPFRPNHKSHPNIPEPYERMQPATPNPTQDPRTPSPYARNLQPQGQVAISHSLVTQPHRQYASCNPKSHPKDPKSISASNMQTPNLTPKSSNPIRDPTYKFSRHMSQNQPKTLVHQRKQAATRNPTLTSPHQSTQPATRNPTLKSSTAPSISAGKVGGVDGKQPFRFKNNLVFWQMFLKTLVSKKRSGKPRLPENPSFRKTLISGNPRFPAKVSGKPGFPANVSEKRLCSH